MGRYNDAFVKVCFMCFQRWQDEVFKTPRFDEVYSEEWAKRASYQKRVVKKAWRPEPERWR